jgi:hypothetical protein
MGVKRDLSCMAADCGSNLQMQAEAAATPVGRTGALRLVELKEVRFARKSR